MATMAQYKQKLLDEFETRKDDWTFGTFETRLSELRPGTSYHDAKGIISDAHKQGLWPNTVKRYILTNYQSCGNVSCELSAVLSDVLSTLPEKEKNIVVENAKKNDMFAN